MSSRFIYAFRPAFIVWGRLPGAVGRPCLPVPARSYRWPQCVMGMLNCAGNFACRSFFTSCSNSWSIDSTPLMEDRGNNSRAFTGRGPGGLLWSGGPLGVLSPHSLAERGPGAPYVRALHRWPLAVVPACLPNVDTSASYGRASRWIYPCHEVVPNVGARATYGRAHCR